MLTEIRVVYRIIFLPVHIPLVCLPYCIITFFCLLYRIAFFLLVYFAILQLSLQVPVSFYRVAVLLLVLLLPPPGNTTTIVPSVSPTSTKFIRGWQVTAVAGSPSLARATT